MGALDQVMNAMPKTAGASEQHVMALMSTANTLMQKQMQDQTVVQQLAKEVRSAIKTSFKDVGGNLLGGESFDEVLTKGLEQAFANAVGKVSAQVSSQVSEALDSLEAALVAEVRAIKFPDIPQPKDVDFDAVIAAIHGIRIPAPIVKASEVVPQKTSWTFEFKRNKRSGLLEEVIAR